MSAAELLPIDEVEEEAEEEAIDRLETPARDKVQALILMRLFTGEQADNKRLAWIDKHGKEISDIVDNATYKDSIQIRELARAGDYLGAAKLLFEALPSEVFPPYVDKLRWPTKAEMPF